MKNKVHFTNPRINSGKETVVGLDSIKAKVFCQHHNQMCSPLDQAALVLVSSIRQRDPKYDRTLISGYDIERWMMKCFCAVVIGNVTGESSEEDKLFVQRAFDYIIMPVTSNRSGGMYTFSEVGSRIDMDPDQVSFNIIRWADKKIAGMTINLCGIPFTLIPQRKITMEIVEKDRLSHRPQIIKFMGSLNREIRFSWYGADGGAEIKIERKKKS